MAAEISSDDKETSLYLTQIRYLDEQLERCQLKCDELEKQNADLEAQCGALEKDKRDIEEYLKHSVAVEELRLSELAEQLESQQQAAEQESEELQRQHSHDKKQLQERMEALSTERATHEEKFEEQNKHLMAVVQQVAHIESLKRQLLREKEEHDAVVNTLKEEAWMEKRRIINKVEKWLEESVQEKVSSIVSEKKAQHEEQAQQHEELLQQSLALRSEKDRLHSVVECLHFEMELLQKDLDKSSRVRVSHNKDVMQLMKRCRRLEAELQACRGIHDNMLASEEAVRLQLASTSEECGEKAAEAAELQAFIVRKRRRRRQLEEGVHEAVIILRHILTDLEKAPGAQWRRLQEILESTAPPRTGPTLKHSSEGSSREQSPDPTPARVELLSPPSDALFLMARYRPGDLGFVPQPTWRHRRRPPSSQKKSSGDDPPAPAPL